MRADLSDPARARDSVVRAVDAHGHIDGLVDAAGLPSHGPLLGTTPELFDQHMAINPRAPFLAMRAAVADMTARRARGIPRPCS